MFTWCQGLVLKPKKHRPLNTKELWQSKALVLYFWSAIQIHFLLSLNWSYLHSYALTVFSRHPEGISVGGNVNSRSEILSYEWRTQAHVCPQSRRNKTSHRRSTVIVTFNWLIGSNCLFLMSQSCLSHLLFIGFHWLYKNVKKHSELFD